MADPHENLHIAMLPWLAFGHMMPYLELAKLMAGKGHRISFLSVPGNIDRLPKPPPDLAPLISFVNLPLPTVEHLPEGAGATSDLPYDKIQFLKKAYDMLQEPVARFLESSDPDWIMYDFAPYWAGPIASRLGIRSVFFSITTAASLGFFGPIWALKGGDYRKTPEDFTKRPNWVPFPTKVAFRHFEIKKIFDAVIGNASGVTDLYRFGAGQESCDIIAARSSYEVEPEWLSLLKDIHTKPIFPVGQLPPRDPETRGEMDSWRSIKEWLDSQKKGTVVYVAFGSEAKPSQIELTEIALGLELSGLPFFWVLKTRLGSSDTESVVLPNGFEERVKGRGVVWDSWVPQLKILAHDSVGGFLTHAGWSSVVEALSFERALILFTFLADQGLNARFLEERQIGYPIPRNESDGSVTRQSVAESLRLVMVEEKGRVYREKAKEMRPIFGDKNVQERYVNNLLNYLKEHRPVKHLKSKGITI
ncbi:UDP-glycosyltransferase 91A1-like [Eucalyptus grandis]|uniref:UDP-glycosyltransferase 91A1-like n=1 Tax=Eucalyptus grandis TaxID=71139 RepID=UPI00192EE005|nr:UDP-glycosyltransferase 91A1-like [Eucalyptus grandis]